jgi:NAD(P)-dependent dehydrogenase (short-subunit alcohol dehydrogenase family)
MREDQGMKVVVIGASGGIGQALVRQLAAWPEVEAVTATWRRERPAIADAKVILQQLDAGDEAAVTAWADAQGEIDWLINAAGMLHTPNQGPEKTIRQFDPAFFLQNMAVNAVPSLLLAKHLQPKFKHGRPAVFATVSAKVGSIEDNRLGGWFSYRASKAALNMGLKTLAIEWRRTLPNVTVAALHPGTTDTALSKPFQRNVPPDQLFTPERSVGDMLQVLRGLTPQDSGSFWAFDGERLPW